MNSSSDAPVTFNEESNPYTRYWQTRQSMLYYAYVDSMIRRLAFKAGSLIDVGSHDTSISEAFDWIPTRHALDIMKPYSSEKVQGIKADFMEYAPKQKYDFAICLQVLEHIPDAEAFARKLFAVAKNVLVSVPYMWPQGSSKYHCQDPVNREKLYSWFGRKADYSIVVKEPLTASVKSRRLIAYYDSNPGTFNLKAFRRKR